MQSSRLPLSLLAIDPCETEAVLRLGGHAASGLVLLCDHASNALPPEYGTLGLRESYFEKHIAYDIGAAGVTRHLSRLLRAPALLTRNSRLLIDCNRGIDDPTLVMRLSDGIIIPGNRDADTDEIGKRIERFYKPYHQAIASLLDAFSAGSTVPLIVSIHSFTDRWKGVPRPWHVGILWDNDERLARRLITGFGEMQEFVVGDNQPYTGRLKGDTLWQHGTRRGLAHAIIEIRQDLIREESDQLEWSQRIAGVLTKVLADSNASTDLRRVHFFGSRTGELS